jgi:hypothetical protein
MIKIKMAKYVQCRPLMIKNKNICYLNADVVTGGRGSGATCPISTPTFESLRRKSISPLYFYLKAESEFFDVDRQSIC